YSQLHTSDSSLCFVRESGTGPKFSSIRYSNLNMEILPKCKESGALPSSSNSEYYAWVCEVGKEVKIMMAKITDYDKEEMYIASYDLKFHSNGKYKIFKLSLDGKFLYTFVTENEKVKFKAFKNPFIE
ncbi:MAG: hypothetical protein C0594_17110, partial [Marinilabiliales bacterium]